MIPDDTTECCLSSRNSDVTAKVIHISLKHISNVIKIRNIPERRLWRKKNTDVSH